MNHTIPNEERLTKELMFCLRSRCSPPGGSKGYGLDIIRPDVPGFAFRRGGVPLTIEAGMLRDLASRKGTISKR